MTIVYSIVVDYTTGDSFSTERMEEDIGIATTNLDKAKINLARIKEHYELYKDSCDTGAHQLELLTDREERVICPFWIGYFETLHGARILIEDDPSMGFIL